MLTIGLMMLVGFLRSKQQETAENTLITKKLSFDSINDNPIGI